MIEYESCKQSKNPLILFKWLRYKLDFIQEHPNYFRPSGLVIFTGPQGTGKTLSAVLYTSNLMKMYPNAKLVTNLELKEYPIDNKRVFFFENGDDLNKYKNGEQGVIFLIDEIQLYFNSLQSKNINTEVMTTISQQRKQRIHIIATSQVFGRMAKPLREQFSDVFVCKNYFGNFQVNKLVNRDSIEDFDNGTNLKGQIKKKFFWFHKPSYYGLYDTYYVIEKNKFVSEEEKKVGIYGSELSNCR